MSRWIKIDTLNDFTGDVKVYVLQDTPIAVFRRGGEFYAIDDTCSHEEASLAEGELDGYEIECPLHGARFDIRTGKNLSFPAVIPVRAYPVKVENGEIWIQMDGSH